MNKEIYYIWVSEQKRFNDITESEAEKIYKKALALGMKIVHIESDDYPDALRLIDNPPLVLYCYGDITLLKNSSVAIVGTRRASPYGRWAAYEIGRTLAECGVTHVSGMAEGIDSVGHKAVLDFGGESIAVLGTGVDVCFPRSSREIYEKLIQEGLVISEYSPGTSGRPQNFPERNRIISGLSGKVVIVEGALRSGSLITAKLALDQGKDLFAVPGNINQPNSIGPNCLIEDGAIPIVNPTEIALTLGISSMKKQKAEIILEGLDKDIYELITDAGSISVEEIIQFFKKSPEMVIAELTSMELQGFIQIKDGIVCI